MIEKTGHFRIKSEGRAPPDITPAPLSTARTSEIPWKTRKIEGLRPSKKCERLV